MLMLSRRFYLPVILIVVVGPLIGCSSYIAVGDAGNEGLPNPNGEQGSGSAQAPGSDIGGGDADSGGGDEPEPGTGEPSDPGTEGPPAAQPAGPPEPSDEALPDFSAVDANPDSARYQEAVSPRDYLGQISAWYFAHAT